jgi:hypothetical protein
MFLSLYYLLFNRIALVINIPHSTQSSYYVDPTKVCGEGTKVL